ncbi:PAS domain-containing protein [Thalassococcus profundi]|uniref:PAS domain-containing protein n=1 Tax=Thalassococcus profundi TaxID=2282382 RepID=A0A369TKA0_9RHOB|nr:PAS domain-containing protein [Thalassococcus profundi]RDD65084.1 PAS domain-containing protein [Thalassococcus profundi]
MPSTNDLQFGALRDKLQRLPYALTISNVSLPDHPLVFINSAFSRMTGYGEEMLGQNCRFLQGDLENGAARAELRETLEGRKRTQVVFHNQRKDGERFYNLLLLERLRDFEGLPSLAIGSQFDLGPDNPEHTGLFEDTTPGNPVIDVTHQAKAIQFERRRVVADAAVRLIQSWCVLNEVLLRD